MHMKSPPSLERLVSTAAKRLCGFADSQAAAYKLGADYPTELYENDFARLCMNLYLALAHGKWLSKKRTSQF